MKNKNLLTTSAIFALFVCINPASAKEIALTFDDASMDSSPHSESVLRTETLIKKLKASGVPSVMVFANPCKREDSDSVIAQLKKYKDGGHLIGNHTCTHPRLDTVGFDAYAKDARKGDELLPPLFSGQKFFRFHFLNEGSDEKLRDEMRGWLSLNKYRKGMVSVDNDDYLFSFKINQAKQRGKKINYEKVKELYLNHTLEAADFYDSLAKTTLGRSPKHIMLLHEMDATVMFIDSFIAELRKRGWKFISPAEAFDDPLYSETPKNTYAGNGAYEKTGEKTRYSDFEELKAKLNKILGL